MKYIVYMHISPSNKKYIGITKHDNPNKRWLNGKGYRGNKYFTRAINKYGWDNFEHIVIARELLEDEAKWLEIELIKVNNSTNPNKGYNQTLGGEGANGWHHSDDFKKKQSLNNSGKNNPMYGVRFTGESHWNYGKKASEETRQKLIDSHKGKIGKDSSRAKIIMCITTGKCFYGSREAGEFYGIKSYKHINSCCNNKRKQCGNKKWCHIKGDILLNFSHGKIYRVARPLVA